MKPAEALYSRFMRKRQAACMFAVLAGMVFCLDAAGKEGNMEGKKIQIYNAVTQQMEEADPVLKSEAEWRRQLGPAVCAIMHGKKTEKPFSGDLYSENRPGLYVCAACGTHLFFSENKFESGTGWPSFLNPVHPNNVICEEDTSFSMVRVEVLCARCRSHLGHVFDDGPAPAGKRYCINSLALRFIPEPAH